MFIRKRILFSLIDFVNEAVSISFGNGLSGNTIHSVLSVYVQGPVCAIGIIVSLDTVDCCYIESPVAVIAVYG